jgi:hypothetical protein
LKVIGNADLRRDELLLLQNQYGNAMVDQANQSSEASLQVRLPNESVTP